MLSLTTPYDIQIELKDFVRDLRKSQKLSIDALEKKSGVPNSTIRKFESTGNISLRQFLMIYSVVGKLSDIQQLTQTAAVPNSIAGVLRNA